VVIGVPRVELAHSSELPDADLFVRLSDVDAAGRSRNVTEGFVRIRGSATATQVLDLRAAAHAFRAGHRVRVLVAGGSFPQYVRNPGTGENPLAARALLSNRHTVRVAGGVSTVRLPVV
jgi:putative CocE/NonD family hydrolase